MTTRSLQSTKPLSKPLGSSKTHSPGDCTACAAIAVLRLSDLKVQESVVIRRPLTFPYVPGLLAFREVPVVLEALASLETQPDLLLCDGNGYIHPRRCGLACHLGILSALPAIGVAKTPYLGEHKPLAEHRGAWQPIHDAGEGKAVDRLGTGFPAHPGR